MIPNREQNTVTSTVTGERVSMGIAEGAEAHLMSILTDAYSDPELAALREYATNARDSHLAAGVDEPIEVELPSQLRQQLVIRDRGLGLSAEDIRAIYSQYGASTKRESNDFNGTLGIGCKAALTYTDQFTVEARKAGREVVVAVSRDEDGGGTQTIVREGPTDEPNGVAITIPTKREHGFRERAEALFRWWPKGSVLVNGKAPDPAPTGTPIPGELELTIYPSRELDASVVIMGGVPYPVESPRDYGFPVSANFAAVVPIGSVDFPPSREALSYTKRTKATLTAIGQQFVAGREAALQAHVELAETRADAMSRYIAGRWLAPQADMRWHGQPMPTSFKGAFKRLASGRYGYGSKSYGGAHVDTTELALDQYAEAPIVVTSYTNEGWSAAQRRKLEAWMAQDDPSGVSDASKAILSRDPVSPGGEWGKGVRTVSWDTVKKWKDPNAATATAAPSWSSRSVSGTYYTYLADGTTREKHPASELAQIPNGHLYVVESRKYEAQYLARKLRACDPQAVLMEVSSTRIAKCRRDLNPLDPSPVIVAGRDKLLAQVSTREAGLLWLRTDRDAGFVGALAERVDELDDPELAHYLRCKAECEDTAIDTLHKRLAALGAAEQAASPDYWEPKVDALADRYPLVTACARVYHYNRGTDVSPELIVYVNAKYAQANTNSTTDLEV